MLLNARIQGSEQRKAMSLLPHGSIPWLSSPSTTTRSSLSGSAPGRGGIFVGFSTRARRNRPQFLTGTSSVLQTMDLGILATSFNITNAAMKQLLVPQKEFIFSECTSCAEEEEKRMLEEERQKEQKKEKERKEEEEGKERGREEYEAATTARRRKEEAAAPRRKEEEEDTRSLAQRKQERIKREKGQARMRKKGGRVGEGDEGEGQGGGGSEEREWKPRKRI